MKKILVFFGWVLIAAISIVAFFIVARVLIDATSAAPTAVVKESRVGG